MPLWTLAQSISTDEIEQVARVLAKLELADSKYGLIERLHRMKSGDFDELHVLLTNWTVRDAKIALDEVQSRLKLIEEKSLRGWRSATAL